MAVSCKLHPWLNEVVRLYYYCSTDYDSFYHCELMMSVAGDVQYYAVFSATNFTASNK